VGEGGGGGRGPGLGSWSLLTILTADNNVT